MREPGARPSASLGDLLAAPPPTPPTPPAPPSRRRRRSWTTWVRRWMGLRSWSWCPPARSGPETLTVPSAPSLSASLIPPEPLWRDPRAARARRALRSDRRPPRPANGRRGGAGGGRSAERSGPIGTVEGGRTRGRGGPATSRCAGGRGVGLGEVPRRSGASACAMNRCQICAGHDPPVTVIGVVGGTIGVWPSA